jgi:hypothetical protein
MTSSRRQNYNGPSAYYLQGLRAAACGVRADASELKLNGLHNPFTGHAQAETLRNLLQMLS